MCWYAAAPYEFVTGESIAYLGRSYRLMVLPGESGRMKLKHRCLEVPVRKETREAVRGALESWFRGKAEERLPARVEGGTRRSASRCRPSSSRTSESASRAGAGTGPCASTGDSSRCRDWMVDYAVVRQLVRLWLPRTRRDFWEALEGVMPDCGFRREALRREEPGLFW